MNRTNYFVFGFLAGVLLAGGIRLVQDPAKREGIEPALPSDRAVIQVQVEGAVAAPGVYVMDEDSRLMDALAAAGGLLPEADWSGLNLAANLYDTQKIEIPYLSDTQLDDGAVAEIPPPDAGFAAGSQIQSPITETQAPSTAT